MTYNVHLRSSVDYSEKTTYYLQCTSQSMVATEHLSLFFVFNGCHKRASIIQASINGDYLHQKLLALNEICWSYLFRNVTDPFVEP